MDLSNSMEAGILNVPFLDHRGSHARRHQTVAAYAVVGGVPPYLEWLDPDQSLSDNIRNVILAPGSMLVAEPTFLLYDEIRQPRTHLAILKAIGTGHHTYAFFARIGFTDAARAKAKAHSGSRPIALAVFANKTRPIVILQVCSHSQ
jgi:hypothetical protein